MDRYEFGDYIREGVTLHLHGRSGGLWASRTLEVASKVQAEREVAYFLRQWPKVSIVAVDRGRWLAGWTT